MIPRTRDGAYLKWAEKVDEQFESDLAPALCGNSRMHFIPLDDLFQIQSQGYRIEKHNEKAVPI